MKKLSAKDILLIITSILFVAGVFMGRMVCLLFTIIWLADVLWCMHNMVKRNYGSVSSFIHEAEGTGNRNLDNGSNIRGLVEISIAPIFIVGFIGIICALLSLIV